MGWRTRTANTLAAVGALLLRAAQHHLRLRRDLQLLGAHALPVVRSRFPDMGVLTARVGTLTSSVSACLVVAATFAAVSTYGMVMDVHRRSNARFMAAGSPCLAAKTICGMRRLSIISRPPCG